jgi:integrase
MTNNNSHKINMAALRFFKRARSIKDTSRIKFQGSLAFTNKEVQEVFPQERWRAMQDEWMLSRIRVAMDEVFVNSNYRNQFSIEAILTLLKITGLARGKFMRLAGKEWREKWHSLPTSRERVLATIARLVEARIPLEEFNKNLVIAEAGALPKIDAWFSKAMREARRQLLETKDDSKPIVIPTGDNMIEISGCWIDLNADVWDMRPGGGRLIEKRRLRKDVAEVVWILIRDDLLSGELAISTISQIYTHLIWASEMLGAEILDVRKATLDQVQRAWKAYSGTLSQKRGVRSALLRIFSALFESAKQKSGGNAKDMLSIAAWISVEVRVSSAKPCEEFLSESEVDELLSAALEDIREGVEFTNNKLDLSAITTNPLLKESATPVVGWGTALMILVMLFTGVRKQSVLEMRIGDWAEVHKGIFALIWRHGKKREEKLAILSTSLAILLDLYVERTQVVRGLLKTDRVFMMNDRFHSWCITHSSYDIRNRLYEFVKRHRLQQGGVKLRLHCTMLRRTFTTRELYRGRSIWALRLQLGHAGIASTLRYTQFDRFEHPRFVCGALDKYGKKSLTLWHHPVLLVELSADERKELLAHCRERDQEVGLCRGRRCLKLEQGGALPPCSLCEHLVTGANYLPAWEAEKNSREQEIEALKASGRGDPKLPQKKLEYEQFMTNIRFVRKSVAHA